MLARLNQAINTKGQCMETTIRSLCLGYTLNEVENTFRLTTSGHQKL